MMLEGGLLFKNMKHEGRADIEAQISLNITNESRLKKNKISSRSLQELKKCSYMWP